MRDSTRGAGWGDQPGRPLSETIHRLLPTPGFRLGDDRRGAPSAETAAQRYALGRRNLDDAVALLPTPTAQDRCGPGRYRDGYGLNLRTAVSLLPTPRSSDGYKSGPGAWGSKGDPQLPAAVTPERWGDYAVAVARWEQVLGRPAPAPTQPSLRAGAAPQLSPAFVEWMMGLPDRWVTGVPGLSRSDLLRLLGNGVVPAQAAAAVPVLLDRLTGGAS